MSCNVCIQDIESPKCIHGIIISIYVLLTTSYKKEKLHNMYFAPLHFKNNYHSVYKYTINA